MSTSACRISADLTSFRRHDMLPFGAQRQRGKAHLRSLVRRIAANDRVAFVELFDQLVDPVTSALRRQAMDPDQVAGMVARTFVEVSRLAGAHIDTDADVLTWITEIVSRRIVDSGAFAPVPHFAAVAPAAQTVSWAQWVEAELGALLARRPPPSCA